jgi:hypothetical protein
MYVPMILLDPERRPYRGDDNNPVTMIKRLAPLRIESYNPFPSFTYPDEGFVNGMKTLKVEHMDYTQVITYSGREHLIDMPVNEFEEKLNSWNK